jgi:acetyl esterase/lipase
MLPGWDKMSAAERSAAYDNNGAVSDSAALITERNSASKAFRAAHPAHLDVPYGPRERQKFDLYPARDPKAPCLVFIHGGYWQRNSREDFACFAEGLVSSGFSVAMPGYTLCPEVRLADIVAEMGMALDFLKAKGEAHGIAASRIVVSGWSAGAQLAAMALPHPAVSSGLAMSGVYELAPLRDTALNEKLGLSDAEVETLSPLRLPVTPKRLDIAYGTRELPALVGDARDLHAKRAAAHAAGKLIPVPNADHFRILHDLKNPDGVLARAAIELLTA